jgi:hypothetical protein
MAASGCGKAGGGELMKSKSLTLFAGIGLLAACGSGRTPAPYIEAHSLRQLMDTVMEPDAQVFWRSSGAVSDVMGTRDLRPTSAAGWAAARTSAATVAETGNLLLMPMYARARGPDWVGFSQDLVRAGQTAEQAAIRRDGDAMFEAGAKLGAACSACHQAYLPQDQAAKADS